MTPLRPIFGIATAAALTFALTACGGSAYCDSIEAADDTIGDVSNFDPSDVDTLADAQEAFSDVAANAPDDVKDLWQNSADAVQVVIDAEGDPAAIAPEDVERVTSMQEDLTALQTSVEEECDVEFGS